MSSHLDDEGNVLLPGDIDPDLREDWWAQLTPAQRGVVQRESTRRFVEGARDRKRYA